MSIKIIQKINDNTTVELEAENDVEMFRKLSAAQEVYGDAKCPKCGSSHLGFRVRQATDGKKTFDYPERVCLNYKCRAKLTFGVGENGIFPVRFQREDGEYVKDEEGKRIPKGDRGWTKWDHDTQQEV